MIRGAPSRALPSHRRLAQPKLSKPTVHCRSLSLAHLLDDGTPPADLFSVLSKKWASGVVEDKDFVAGRYSRAAVDMDIYVLLETGRTTFELLRSLAKRRLEGLNRLALMKINNEGLVAVLHSMLCVAASAYEDGPYDLW